MVSGSMLDRSLPEACSDTCCITATCDTVQGLHYHRYNTSTDTWGVNILARGSLSQGERDCSTTWDLPTTLSFHGESGRAHVVLQHRYVLGHARCTEGGNPQVHLHANTYLCSTAAYSGGMHCRYNPAETVSAGSSHQSRSRVVSDSA